MPITLFSYAYSPRLAYVLRVFFEHLCPMPYQLVHDVSVYLAASGPKINYSKAPLDSSEVWIIPEPLLYETNLSNSPIQVNHQKGCPWISWSGPAQPQLPGDPLASAFYCLSRYEEYLPFEEDRYGRFAATQSLAWREGFLGQVVVHRWLYVLLEALQDRHPNFTWIPVPYRFVPTYDVDNPWAYAYQVWWRQVGGLLKDTLQARWDKVKDRWQAWLNPDQDPFYRFDWLHTLHAQRHLSPRFFLLLGDRARYDTNPSHQLPAQQRLIRELAARYPLGIHPSYRSNQEPERLVLEKQRLESIAGQPITHSRQHFLKLRFPQTYQALLAAGIQADHSMGYADALGFRAGIAVPFPWYDLSQETTTELLIHPFTAMDVTLKQYLQLDVEGAHQHLQRLHQELQQHGGELGLLWHNSSFYAADGWLAWDQLYLRVWDFA